MITKQLWSINFVKFLVDVLFHAVVPRGMDLSILCSLLWFSDEGYRDGQSSGAILRPREKPLRLCGFSIALSRVKAGDRWCQSQNRK